MAILNLDLLNNPNTVIDSSNADETGNVINITAIGNSTLTVDGVEATVNSIAGVSVGSSATFNVQNDGVLNIDQGLLNVGALSSMTFGVGDSSTMNLDGSTLSLGALTNLINKPPTVNFSGEYHTGHFNYDPPAVSLLSVLSPMTFNTNGMQPTDTFTVSGKNLSLSTQGLGGDTTAYRDGALHLTTGGGLLTPKVAVVVPMTQSEFQEFLTNRANYLSGSTFTFPGTLAPMPCFVKGSLIQTPSGLVAIEDLQAGDMVLTKDSGIQPILWVGSRKLSSRNLGANPNLMPIRIAAGALGGGSPNADLLVSPQHRVLVRSNIAHRMFGVNEVLVAAKQLLQLDGIDIATDVDGVEYYHMLFNRHEIVYSNGAETESLFTGPIALRAVGKAAADEIFSIFPELRDPEYIPVPARPFLSGRSARKLAVRHLMKRRDLVM